MRRGEPTAPTTTRRPELSSAAPPASTSSPGNAVCTTPPAPYVASSEIGPANAPDAATSSTVTAVAATAAALDRSMARHPDAPPPGGQPGTVGNSAEPPAREAPARPRWYGTSADAADRLPCPRPARLRASAGGAPSRRRLRQRRPSAR